MEEAAGCHPGYLRGTTRKAMILTYTVTGATINTDTHLPQDGFDSAGTALDEAGKHTIVFKSQVAGLADVVWSWTTESAKDDALANILQSIADQFLVAEVDGDGVVTEVVGS